MHRIFTLEETGAVRLKYVALSAVLALGLAQGMPLPNVPARRIDRIATLDPWRYRWPFAHLIQFVINNGCGRFIHLETTLAWVPASTYGRVHAC